MLRVMPEIHMYEKVKEFIDEFGIGKGDLIFTQSFIYNPIIAACGDEADKLFFEDYGSGEPSDVIIDKVFAQIKDKNYKRIIAIGGGSVIDIAKLMVFDTSQKALDMFDKKVPLVKERELIIVPTTCGTGSEATSISIAEIVERKTKMGLVLDDMYADKAVLIPELIKSLPYKFFLFSSVDALIHAAESFLSPKSNSYTELFSVKSMEMIISGYKKILKEGPDSRAEMLADFLAASNYAGIAFDNTGVGAVHALSYPLGGNYHVPHGEANYQFFIGVFKLYDAKAPEGKIKEIKKIISDILGVEEAKAFDGLGELIDSLIDRKALKEYGMKESEVEEFADSVIKHQQRLLANNYVPLSRDEIRDVYKNLY